MNRCEACSKKNGKKSQRSLHKFDSVCVSEWQCGSVTLNIATKKTHQIHCKVPVTYSQTHYNSINLKLQANKLMGAQLANNTIKKIMPVQAMIITHEHALVYKLPHYQIQKQLYSQSKF